MTFEIFYEFKDLSLLKLIQIILLIPQALTSNYLGIIRDNDLKFDHHLVLLEPKIIKDNWNPF